MQKASSVKMVAVPLKEAEQLLELYRNVEAADAHFQRCQSDSFRQHIKGVYRAPLVVGAFDSLRASIDQAKAGDE